MHLFSLPVRVMVHDVSLSGALSGELADTLVEPSWAAGVEGALLCNVPDPGWRTYTLHDDRIAYVLARDVWHYLVVSAGFERFLEGRYSAKTRESFERDEARFVAQFGGVLDLREFRTPAELVEFKAHVSAVRTQEAAASNLPDVHFDQDKGTACGFVLFANGVPVAYIGLLAVADTLQYVCAGEADDFRQWSAGTILHLQAFRRMLSGSQHCYVDFGPGESEIKRQFANGALRSAVVLNLRRTLRNRLLIKAFAFSRRFASGSKAQTVAPKGLAAGLSYSN